MASEWTLFVFQLEWAEAGRMENVTAKEILSLTGRERAKAKEKVCYILTWIFYSQAETLNNEEQSQNADQILHNPHCSITLKRHLYRYLNVITYNSYSNLVLLGVQHTLLIFRIETFA